MKSINAGAKAGTGLNIFYYGKGKGKTTAVMGLAARAAGAGMDVCILQFVKAEEPKKGKSLESGEWPLSSEFVYFRAAGKKYGAGKGTGKIEFQQVGRGFVGILGDKKQRAAHTKAAKQGLELARKAIKSGKYGLVVMDELVSALELKLLPEKDILSLITQKPPDLHLAYTGHQPFKKIIAASDLVSEMKMVKHPYYRGIMAQRGIDF
ncbi:cob(I)yrinic acid a,c-diamide adenosyltransferase [Patescibacteria group bacterium]|nr:cob(I)yrinic acid a,c-diamide adenosyltransferase [Patescibacteria group bacterium]